MGAIPVIMFSGQVDEASAGDAASRGAQGFIGKPFDPRSLIESTKQQLPVSYGALSAATRSRSESWVVDHRVGVLDPFFEALSYAGVVRVRLARDRGRRSPASRGAARGSGHASAPRSCSRRAAPAALKVWIERDRPPLAGSDSRAARRAARDVLVPVRARDGELRLRDRARARRARGLRVPLFALAALISFSRVYVGVHSPLDVLAGAVLGSGSL